MTNEKNITVAYLGDSITKGYALKSPELERYTKLISDKYGVCEKNFGITGTLMAEAGMNRGEKNYLSFNQRLRDPEIYKNDVLVIFGGTNDYFWTDTPIYPGPDAACPGVDYFSVTLDEMCKFIVANRDHEKTLFVTPYPHKGRGNYLGGADYNTANEHETHNKNFTGHTIADYCACIADTCKKYGIPVLDLQKVSGFDYAAMTVDGCHPNPTGHIWLANVIGKELEKLF